MYDMTECYDYCVTDTGVVCDGLEQLDILSSTAMFCEENTLIYIFYSLIVCPLLYILVRWTNISIAIWFLWLR